jgi:hypothetical protein
LGSGPIAESFILKRFSYLLRKQRKSEKAICVQLAIRENSQLMSRREFTKYGLTAVGALVLGSAASIFPGANAADVLTLPKLLYNPSIDQLRSDWDLQKQMLAVDLQIAIGKPVLGKGLIAYDSYHTNIISDLTTYTQKPQAIATFSIGIDGHPSPSETLIIDDDDFGINYTWKTPSNTKQVEFSKGGNNTWTRGLPLPDGFAWDVYFEKSFWNQEKDHPYLIAQIHNSAMGPGNMNQYGMYVYANIDYSAGGPSWPANGFGSNPQTYGQVRTEQTIPAFPKGWEIPTAALALIVTGLTVRRNRIHKLKSSKC